jgi:hypothetical protein
VELDEHGLIFPIGQRFGAQHSSGDHAELVRISTEVVRLPADTFRVWELAHGHPDSVLEHDWTITQLTEVASQDGVTDPASAITNLVDRQVAAVVGRALDDRIAFGRRHLFVPTMVGLGNSSDDPGSFGIGLPVGPVVKVNALLFDLYEWAHLDPDLWTACQNAAAVNRKLEVPDAVATNADQMLAALVDQFHAAFLVSGAGYVDRALTVDRS